MSSKDNLEIEEDTLTNEANKIEDKIISKFLTFELKRAGSNLHIKLQRLVRIMKVVINSPHLVVCEEGALNTLKSNSGQNIENLKTMLPNSGFLLAIRRMRMVEFVDEIAILQNSTIVEQDNCQKLYGQSSSIFRTLVKRDRPLDDYLSRIFR